MLPAHAKLSECAETHGEHSARITHVEGDNEKQWEAIRASNARMNKFFTALLIILLGGIVGLWMRPPTQEGITKRDLMDFSIALERMHRRDG